MQSLTQINEDDGGPPLSNRDVKNLVILTELPFVVSFQERVKVGDTSHEVLVLTVIGNILLENHKKSVFLLKCV